MMTRILSLLNLRVRHKGEILQDRDLVSNLNLEIKQKEFVAIVGESGSGKSLTALSI